MLNGTRTIRGLATRFNQPFVDDDGGLLMFSPRSMDAWISHAGKSVPVLLMHNHSLRLGLCGAVDFKRTVEALEVSFTLARSVINDKTIQAVATGFLPAMSTQYLIKEHQTIRINGEEVTEILRADVLEISIVDHPRVDGCHADLAGRGGSLFPRSRTPRFQIPGAAAQEQWLASIGWRDKLPPAPAKPNPVSRSVGTSAKPTSPIPRTFQQLVDAGLVVTGADLARGLYPAPPRVRAGLTPELLDEVLARAARRLRSR